MVRADDYGGRGRRRVVMRKPLSQGARLHAMTGPAARLTRSRLLLASVRTAEDTRAPGGNHGIVLNDERDRSE
jgi:hypothetical protein